MNHSPNPSQSTKTTSSPNTQLDAIYQELAKLNKMALSMQSKLNAKLFSDPSPSAPNRSEPILETLSKIAPLTNAVLLFFILVILGINVFRPEKTETLLWEYEVIGIDDYEFDTVINEMGQQGWDIAFARRALSGEGRYSKGLYEVIFKRPISQEQLQEQEISSEEETP